MKKLLATALVALTLFSCSKEATEKSSTNPHPEEVSDRVVTINFGSNKSETKTFFDGEVAGESWEKTITSMAIYIFKEDSEDIVVQRKLTSTEMTALAVNLVIPNCEKGKKYTFYAVANKTPLVVNTKSELLAVIIDSPTDYNGSFADVTTKSVRNEGFVMSGYVDATIEDLTKTLELSISLKRVVSKVAIQASTTDLFSATYNGAIRVDKAIIEKSATDCLLIEPTPVVNRTMDQSFAQTPNISDKFFQNLFYIYENATLADGNKVNIKLETTYDADGDFNTTPDQQPIIYNVEIKGDNQGAISRNTYYKLNIFIDGLTGKNVNATISIADWKTIETIHNVGQ